MTEREQLELAAKAAGITGTWVEALQCLELIESNGCINRWNPRDDDGDAFRLAVDLKLIVRCYEGMIIVDGDGSVTEENMTDRHAATRLAIFKAAVEIGRNMS